MIETHPHPQIWLLYVCMWGTFCVYLRWSWAEHDWWSAVHLVFAIKASPSSLEVDNPLNCLIFRKNGTCPWPQQRNWRICCQQHNCVKEEGVCVVGWDWECRTLVKALSVTLACGIDTAFAAGRRLLPGLHNKLKAPWRFPRVSVKVVERWWMACLCPWGLFCTL